MNNLTKKIIYDYACNNGLNFGELLSDFENYCINVGWEDRMNDYTNAKNDEPCTEREIENIEEVQAEKFIETLKKF